MQRLLLTTAALLALGLGPALAGAPAEQGKKGDAATTQTERSEADSARATNCGNAAKQNDSAAKGQMNCDPGTSSGSSLPSGSPNTGPDASRGSSAPRAHDTGPDAAGKAR